MHTHNRIDISNVHFDGNGVLQQKAREKEKQNVPK